MGSKGNLFRDDDIRIVFHVGQGNLNVPAQNTFVSTVVFGDGQIGKIMICCIAAGIHLVHLRDDGTVALRRLVRNLVIDGAPVCQFLAGGAVTDVAGGGITEGDFLSQGQGFVEQNTELAVFGGVGNLIQRYSCLVLVAGSCPDIGDDVEAPGVVCLQIVSHGLDLSTGHPLGGFIPKLITVVPDALVGCSIDFLGVGLDGGFGGVDGHGPVVLCQLAAVFCAADDDARGLLGQRVGTADADLVAGGHSAASTGGHGGGIADAGAAHGAGVYGGRVGNGVGILTASGEGIRKICGKCAGAAGVGADGDAAGICAVAKLVTQSPAADIDLAFVYRDCPGDGAAIFTEGTGFGHNIPGEGGIYIGIIHQRTAYRVRGLDVHGIVGGDGAVEAVRVGKFGAVGDGIVVTGVHLGQLHGKLAAVLIHGNVLNVAILVFYGDISVEFDAGHHVVQRDVVSRTFFRGDYDGIVHRSGGGIDVRSRLCHLKITGVVDLVCHMECNFLLEGESDIALRIGFQGIHGCFEGDIAGDLRSICILFGVVFGEGDGNQTVGRDVVFTDDSLTVINVAAVFLGCCDGQLIDDGPVIPVQGVAGNHILQCETQVVTCLYVSVHNILPHGFTVCPMLNGYSMDIILQIIFIFDFLRQQGGLCRGPLLLIHDLDLIRIDRQRAVTEDGAVGQGIGVGFDPVAGVAFDGGQTIGGQYLNQTHMVG